MAETDACESAMAISISDAFIGSGSKAQPMG
eukprot:CAMPEP_0202708808 /NCGR_PEP_ID=MMETSP1385-20130828/20973_1 /ASSEMBLY_ACC=CAM_ASM_000861 /TAXON_ID=933848 /ORGANISM="Elphidium margaritaceum" /LENGTH=30 /DNA_ID= /DNA_START= /DNA_END= /DNA_ORIENTATION=